MTHEDKDQAGLFATIVLQGRRRRCVATALLVGALVLYHVNGGFLVGRDPTATIALPLSVMREGNLSFMPDEAPHMFAWTYQVDHAQRRVRLESWDQKAATMLTWSSDPRNPGLIRLGLVDRSLSPEITCGQLRAAGRLTPLGPDYYLVPSIDPARRGYINTFGPGAGLTALPLMAAESLFVDDLAQNKAALWYGGKFAASLCVAVSVAFVYLAAAELVAPQAALVIALAYGAGTCVWSVSSQALWQSGPNVMFLALAVWCLVQMNRADWWAVPCGVAAACAVLCRPTSALAVIAIGLYLLGVAWRRIAQRAGWSVALRPALYYGLAGLPWAIWLGYHHWYYLGSPLAFPDLVASRALAEQKVGVPDVWHGSFFEGLWGLLLSPSRGMLVYSPVLAFGIWGAVQAWRDARWRVLRPLGLAAALLLATSAKWYDWAGGWSFGYRLMIDAAPLLAVSSAAIVDRVRQKRLLKAVLAVTLLWSVGVQALGAYAYDVTGWNNRKAFAVTPPGQKRSLLFYTPQAAAQAAAQHHAQVQVIYLDIDRKPYHRRLWSIRDSQLVYYLTHLAEARENRKRMIEEFLRQP